MKAKAPSQNPSLVFEDVGSTGSRVEFRKSGNSPYTLSLVYIDSANKSTIHTLITNNGSRNWVIPSELTAVKNSFQGGVNTLYEECVSCGVTPSAKTPAAIAAAIQKIAAKVHIVSLGTGTSINVKSKLPDVYKTLTKDNFFVEIKSFASNGGARNTDDAQYPQFGSIDCSATMSKSYNASTGVLTIKGLSASKQSDTSGWVRWVETDVSINVYCAY